MKNLLLTTIMALTSVACLAACGHAEKKENMEKKTEGKKVLVAFFSRTGENYGVGNIKKGNTHIVAEIIARTTGGDLFEIQPVKAYPQKYDTCTKVAKQEKESNARPAIKADKAIDNYDIIFIGYPIWWGDAPMPVYTWIDNHKWQGKTIIPFCTHEGSGLGDTEKYIGKACKGATIGKGIAITGSSAQNSQTQTEKTVNKWLSELGL